MRLTWVVFVAACQGRTMQQPDAAADRGDALADSRGEDASIDAPIDALPPPPRRLALATLGSRDALRVYVATPTSFRKILQLSDPLGYGTSVAWTDYDSDGRDDLVSIFAVPNMPGANEMLILHSDDTGLNDAGGRQMNPALLLGYDAENDGDGDVYIAMQGGSDMLFRSNGMQLPQYYSWTEAGNSAWEYGVAAGDLTGDGRPDVVLARGLYGEAISLGTMGAPSPTWSRSATSGSESSGASVVDFNGDGRLDAAFTKVNTSATVGSLEVFSWNGSMFAPLYSMATEGMHSMDWADLDGDGDADLAGCVGGTGVLRIYRRNGATFDPHPINSSNLPCYRLGWGDYDIDGDPDLAVAGSGLNMGITVYANQNATFTPVFHDDTPVSALAWGRCPVNAECFPQAPTL